MKKDGWEYIDMLWCQGAQNIGLSNRMKLNQRKSAPCDHNARQSQTDGRTDEHHDSSATMCLLRIAR